jgi:hypothetical protein
MMNRTQPAVGYPQDSGLAETSAFQSQCRIRKVPDMVNFLDNGGNISGEQAGTGGGANQQENFDYRGRLVLYSKRWSEVFGCGWFVGGQWSNIQQWDVLKV